MPATVFADQFTMQRLRIPTVPGFEEILALLRAWVSSLPAGSFPDGMILLGDHDNPSGQEWLLDDPLVAEIVRNTTRGWGGDAFGGTPGLGEALAQASRPPGEPGAAVRSAFSRVLRNGLGPDGDGARRRRRVTETAPSGMGALPNRATAAGTRSSVSESQACSGRSMRRRTGGSSRPSRPPTSTSTSPVP